MVEDVESRPHRAVPFVVEREKEVQEWNEQKLPKVLPGFCGGRLPGRSSEEKGREGGEPDDGREERKFRSEITQEVVASIKEERVKLSTPSWPYSWISTTHCAQS